MTKSGSRKESGEYASRCGWCRHPLPASSGPGRPKKFCSQKCRQWDWVARQRAAELELSENELVVAREELDNLKDMIFVLQCAVNDVRNDLESPRQTKDSLNDMLTWLLDAADPVTNASFGSPVIRP